MWFDFARQERFSTQYPPNETPVTVDVLESGFIVAFLILLVSFLVASPTSILKTSIFRFLRITILLLIGLFLLLGNFGQEWEVGNIRSKTPYKAGSSVEINASIGIKIGLRSVNVTLKAQPDPVKLQKEIIDYNERFSWTWDQGRFGFGPFSGHLQQEFRAAQYRGLPIPILWVMDYFIIDGEGFRWGRFYRTAGWYSHIVLYCAFTCWLLSLILFRSVIVYGAYCLGVCGILQLVANLLWLVIRNPNPLVIHFENAAITTKFGASYWLTFSSGIICVIFAAIIIICDWKSDAKLYTFFGVDPLNRYDEVADLTKNEGLQLRKKKPTKNDLPLDEMNRITSCNIENEHVDIKTNSEALGPPVIRTNKPKHLMPKIIIEDAPESASSC